MANGIVIKRKVVSHKMFFIKGSALNFYFAGVAAGFAANLVSRFEIYFAIKIQSSAFAPRFQNPFEAAKRKSSRGLEHSKTLRVHDGRRKSRQRLGLRQPSAAFPRRLAMEQTKRQRVQGNPAPSDCSPSQIVVASSLWLDLIRPQAERYIPSTVAADVSPLHPKLPAKIMSRLTSAATNYGFGVGGGSRLGRGVVVRREGV
jgi:hypothetical protein